MADEYVFKARQYFDFSQEHQEELNEDSYFEVDNEDDLTRSGKVSNFKVNHEEIVETELSNMESDSMFFSPEAADTSSRFSPLTINPKSKIKKSLSLGDLLPSDNDMKTKLTQAMNDLNFEESRNHQEVERPPSACSYLGRSGKTISQESINRLAQPKRYASSENLNNNYKYMSLAEAVNKFQSGTPKRFRSKSSSKINKVNAVQWGGTKAQTPKLMTMRRARGTTAISHEQQEKLEMEEAKKFKIRANPINRKVLKGPLKPPIEKKPLTAIAPFHLTEFKKKAHLETAKAQAFKAQPIPKSLNHPFKVQHLTQKITKPQTPNFSKRLSAKMQTEPQKVAITDEAPKPFKPSRTTPVPFSFENRDKQLLKKKEEHINKILEEERKAREFHARPPPKGILNTHNGCIDQISNSGSSKSFKKSTEELNTTVFKAKPATVLAMKPFEPKKDEHHVIQIEPFQFSTNNRVEARHKFEQELKEKEETIMAFAKEKEEMQKKQEEEAVAKLRKLAEHKAQPIRKYKPIQIKPANKITMPISPMFHTDRIRNKENIEN